MHVPRIETRTLDETVEALDLGQTPADIVFLSFSDSDLNALARAYDAFPEPKPTLRIASLAALRHPFSVDLYLEKVCARAKLVVARALGGADYWRYGVDELSALARRSGVKLALLPGDRRRDARLDEASTLDPDAVLQIWRYFDEGGPENMTACLGFFASEIGGAAAAPPPVPVSAVGRFDAACFEAGPGAAHALIVFYRSIYLANDLAPIEALARALRDKGFAVTSVFVTSLKDEAALSPLRAFLDRQRFDVVLNATAFSARLDAGGGTALDALDAPIMQVVLAGVGLDAWRASQRGLGPSDLAMHVALPEIDGRILTRAISFKAASARDAQTEFAAVAHQPLADRVDFSAELALRWASLRRKAPSDKRLACVLPDYPARGGRTGYAVGLDTPASAIAICETLRAAGYDVASGLDAPSLIAALAEGPLEAGLTLAEYEAELASTPGDFRQPLFAAWGDPADDRDAIDGAFQFRFVRLGKLIATVQPDRGDVPSRKGDYHNLTLPPRHAYVAFYFWLTRKEKVDAIIQLGAHGTLEWLPGKAVALSENCAPEVLLGPTPVIYPFIVNNPGEAAQAKRRISAVTIGHLTPPLIAAGSHGHALELEALFDEFAEAQALDPRRARAIATLILERGQESGLLRECAATDKPPEEALVALDAWLCDMKEMRIGDGLHVFGRSPESADGFALPSHVGEGSGVRVPRVTTSTLAGDSHPADQRASVRTPVFRTMVGHLLPQGEGFSARVAACGAAESLGLLRALGGQFVPPGPAGAPARGRLDVLPTGRNLYAIDPRAAPTRNAWEIGRRAAEEIVKRYAQDHGEWPKRIVLDLWGSATMRTGGDDLAQAFALIGCRPTWDAASTRVSGFEVLPAAMLGRPRVDVTLRISGLFRDVFPSQIALFAAAVRAVAALEESAEDNPLAGLQGESPARIFGAAPGAYGVGLGARIARGEWADRSELAETYLAATSHAYDGEGEAREAAAEFRTRVTGAEAFVHAQDLPGQDALDADAFAEHEGGFAAAAAETGANPALYHLDSTIPGTTKIRTLAQEIARSLRGRAANPRWLQGQMRHGHRGAAEIAQSLDNLYCFAALTDAVDSAQFDFMFDATLGDDVVRAFLLKANRQAACHMAGVFEEAARRGFWLSRRNSSARILASVLQEAA
jgi:cobaltochelatase CobN